MLARLRSAGAVGLLVFGSAAGLAGCDKALGRELAPVPAAQAVARPKPVEAPGGPMTEIAAGTARAGSPPGSPDRDPTREADLVPIQLGAFAIDRAPFPNAAAAQAQPKTYAAASAACEQLGKCLCSELEWEHACNASGVSAFGAGAREWTLSDGEGPLAGARGGAGPRPARCGARATVERTGELAFRCCRGPVQSAAYPSPVATPASELGAKAAALSMQDLQKALSAVPELTALAPRFEPFTSSDADAALRRGKRSRDGITAWTFLPSVTAWTPAANEELVVLAGRSQKQTLIAVLYALGDGTYAHAASAILREPDATVALAQRVVDPTPRELLWTSCYGCPNEGGAIRYGDDRRVVIEFR
jgi:hypothetical protein